MRAVLSDLTLSRSFSDEFYVTAPKGPAPESFTGREASTATLQPSCIPPISVAASYESAHTAGISGRLSRY